MEESLVTALQQAELSDGSVEVQKVTLNRKSNRLTVDFACHQTICDEERQRIGSMLQELLPELHIAVHFLDPVQAEQAAREQAEQQAQKKEPPAQTFTDAVMPTPPDQHILMGSSIKTGKRIPIHDLQETEATVVIEGRVVSFEEKEGWAPKNGTGKQSYRVQINVTDEADSIYCVATFYDEPRKTKFVERLTGAVKGGMNVVVRGLCKLPKYGKELQIFISDVNTTDRILRMDTAEEKRVELHLHTRMSTMDGITDTTAAFQTAKRFGHKALAITDHGVVQSFPEAYKAGKKAGVKVVYGVEGYLLRDVILTDMDRNYVVFDLETTGLKPEQAEIIEIGAVRIENGQEVDSFCTFVNDGTIIPSNITKLTGITNEMIADAPPLRDVLTRFAAFCEGCILVGHNSDFDMGFLHYHGAKFGFPFETDYADTLMLSRYLMHDLVNHKLDTVCEALNVTLTDHHRAVDDAKATADVFLKLLDMLHNLDVHQLPIRDGKAHHHEQKSRQKTNHIILLAKTQAGMKNLYRLISYSHLDFFRTRPIIPVSLLNIYRSGLILGSACEQGELYQAILQQKPQEEIEALADWYDFLEIQPRGNNWFMVREGTATEERLLDINRQIVALGEQFHKPVAATGDVHFLNPEDKVYREILMTKLGFADAGEQAPLYFKTTDEMLAEFAYLGEAEAHRVVIEAPNAIADACEELKPFPDGTHAPKIENAEEILTDLAMTKAHEIYGETLPDIVQARLDRELKSIIGNGFSSLYLMAQRLVHKSLSDGYLVGSRGSVGSSLVATFAGITEVNALQPHYVCPNCHFADFDVDREKYAVGVDMPDRDCPKCGTKLRKLGYDIPFEVFLGFDGDKTPDIDLNFSGEYQPVAHKYVEEMFGRGHAFRAGTISGIAEKKAYECIFNYMEKNGKELRNAERERLCQGCLNVKVTTGQHPGGIVIVPKDDDILDYTPINYPADKRDKNTITTHFDFHAMDDRLVKLDILGHDDPTALRMLKDLTGLDPINIPLDDKETMQIFSSTAPLKIDLSALDCDIGSIGVPEFGTGFVRGVLEGTRPTTTEELIRIAGLTHGTDVWLNNAEPLVTNHIAKLNEVLCTRDDIMNYLIAHGVPASNSFSIMEKVRKGKGLTPEMEAIMQEYKIPAWFIDSCHKIKYMFPRGHAVAYSMMSFRIAYYKVHYPAEFYAVYYTVRADAFDITMSAGGPDKVLGTIKEMDKNQQSADTAEKKRLKELITILEVVYEMNLRGIELLPIDIYRSDATKFKVEDGNIRPPFTSMPGTGATAAISLCENREKQLESGNRFLSVEDFQARTGANSGIITSLESCGCFNELPKSNQISLF